jgi:Tubulin-tyrosine ligase family
MVRDSFVSVYNKLDPENKINSFELFGYDFMIDENFKVYLIEANTNP